MSKSIKEIKEAADEQIAELKAKIEAIKKKRDEDIEKAKSDGDSDPVLKKGDLGPDVAVYQGSVDWAKVASSCTFAFAKATEGRTFQDKTFTKARVEAMTSNLAAGAYHFARPDNNSAEDEVQNFVKTVKDAGGEFISLKDWLAGGKKNGLLGVLDFEHQPFSSSWAKAWAVEFEKQTGKKAVVYGYGSSLEPIKSVLNEFAAVWIAGYPNYVGYSGPAPLIHQFTDRGSVSGISSPCDVNRIVR